MKTEKEARLEEYLQRELRLVNLHLPYKKRSLAELLQEDFPHIVLRDGSTHYFKRRELELLASITPRHLWKELYLPILLEVSPEYGEGAVVIKGKIESMVVSKILELEWNNESRIIIYRPQVAILRRKLPTTTQYVFSLRLLSEP